MGGQGFADVGQVVAARAAVSRKTMNGSVRTPSEDEVAALIGELSEGDDQSELSNRSSSIAGSILGAAGVFPAAVAAPVAAAASPSRSGIALVASRCSSTCSNSSSSSCSSVALGPPGRSEASGSPCSGAPCDGQQGSVFVSSAQSPHSSQHSARSSGGGVVLDLVTHMISGMATSKQRLQAGSSEVEEVSPSGALAKISGRGEGEPESEPGERKTHELGTPSPLGALPDAPPLHAAAAAAAAAPSAGGPHTVVVERVPARSLETSRSTVLAEALAAQALNFSAPLNGRGLGNGGGGSAVGGNCSGAPYAISFNLGPQHTTRLRRSSAGKIQANTRGRSTSSNSSQEHDFGAAFSASPPLNRCEKRADFMLGDRSCDHGLQPRSLGTEVAMLPHQTCASAPSKLTRQGFGGSATFNSRQGYKTFGGGNSKLLSASLSNKVGKESLSRQSALQGAGKKRSGKAATLGSDGALWLGHEEGDNGALNSRIDALKPVGRIVGSAPSEALTRRQVKLQAALCEMVEAHPRMSKEFASEERPPRLSETSSRAASDFTSTTRSVDSSCVRPFTPVDLEAYIEDLTATASEIDTANAAASAGAMLSLAESLKAEFDAEDTLKQPHVPHRGGVVEKRPLPHPPPPPPPEQTSQVAETAYAVDVRIEALLEGLTAHSKMKQCQKLASNLVGMAAESFTQSVATDDARRCASRACHREREADFELDSEITAREITQIGVDSRGIDDSFAKEPPLSPVIYRSVANLPSPPRGDVLHSAQRSVSDLPPHDHRSFQSHHEDRSSKVRHSVASVESSASVGETALEAFAQLVGAGFCGRASSRTRSSPRGAAFSGLSTVSSRQSSREVSSRRTIARHCSSGTAASSIERERETGRRQEGMPRPASCGATVTATRENLVQLQSRLASLSATNTALEKIVVGLPSGALGSCGPVRTADRCSASSASPLSTDAISRCHAAAMQAAADQLAACRANLAASIAQDAHAPQSGGGDVASLEKVRVWMDDLIGSPIEKQMAAFVSPNPLQGGEWKKWSGNIPVHVSVLGGSPSPTKQNVRSLHSGEHVVNRGARDACGALRGVASIVVPSPCTLDVAPPSAQRCPQAIGLGVSAREGGGGITMASRATPRQLPAAPPQGTALHRPRGTAPPQDINTQWALW